MLIYDLDPSALEKLLKEWHEPAYRSKQIWQGLYQHLWDSPEQFTNLPKSLREKLAAHATFSPFKVKVFQDSSDGFTRKTLFELPDKNLIEAVLMRYGDPADNPQITASAPNSENLRGAKNRRTERSDANARSVCCSCPQSRAYQLAKVATCPAGA